MTYQGSCHCGAVKYSVEGTVEQVIDCNCSHCSRKGYLLWFVGREQLLLHTPAEKLGTYTFNKHVIDHHFCPQCGCAPFGFGKGPGGVEMAAVNVRCLENVDLKALNVQAVDGKSA